MNRGNSPIFIKKNSCAFRRKISSKSILSLLQNKKLAVTPVHSTKLRFFTKLVATELSFYCTYYTRCVQYVLILPCISTLPCLGSINKDNYWMTQDYSPFYLFVTQSVSLMSSRTIKQLLTIQTLSSLHHSTTLALKTDAHFTLFTHVNEKRVIISKVFLQGSLMSYYLWPNIS